MPLGAFVVIPRFPVVKGPANAVPFPGVWPGPPRATRMPKVEVVASGSAHLGGAFRVASCPGRI